MFKKQCQCRAETEEARSTLPFLHHLASCCPACRASRRSPHIDITSCSGGAGMAAQAAATGTRLAWVRGWGAWESQDARQLCPVHALATDHLAHFLVAAAAARPPPADYLLTHPGSCCAACRYAERASAR